METNNDITERKAAEQRLRAAEQELRRTIDTIPALVCQHDAGWHRRTFFNARWIEQGFSEQDLLSDWSTLVHPEDLPGLMEKRQRSLASGEPYEVEARLRRIDGEYRWFLSATWACGTRAGKSSNDMRPPPISRTSSGPRTPCAAAKLCWRKRRS